MRFRTIVVAALFSATLIGNQSRLADLLKSLFSQAPSSQIPTLKSQIAPGASASAQTERDHSFCGGELTGNFFDGTGHTFPVSLRFQANVKMDDGPTRVEEGLKVVKGRASIVTEWLHIRPHGTKSLTGTGSSDSVRVTKGRVDQIRMFLNNPRQPNSRYEALLSISSNPSSGKAHMDLRGADGSQADLIGPSTCEAS